MKKILTFLTYLIFFQLNSIAQYDYSQVYNGSVSTGTYSLDCSGPNEFFVTGNLGFGTLEIIFEDNSNSNQTVYNSTGIINNIPPGEFTVYVTNPVTLQTDTYYNVIIYESLNFDYDTSFLDHCEREFELCYTMDGGTGDYSINYGFSGWYDFQGQNQFCRSYNNSINATYTLRDDMTTCEVPLNINVEVNTPINANDRNLYVGCLNDTSVLANMWHTAYVGADLTFNTIDTTSNLSVSTLEDPILPPSSNAYWYIITDQISGCDDTALIVLNQDTAFWHNANELTVDCDSTGSGSAEFEVPLFPGATYGFLGGPLTNGSHIFSNLNAGEHILIFEDPASGCIGYDTVRIDGNLAGLLNMTSQVSCSGVGEICVENNSFNSISNLNLIFSGPQTLDTSYNHWAYNTRCFELPDGNYSITATDENGCSNITNFNHSAPVNSLSVTQNWSSMFCANLNYAEIDLSINGSGNYTINMTTPSSGFYLYGDETFPLNHSGNSFILDSILVTDTLSVDIEIIDNINGCSVVENITIYEDPLFVQNRYQYVSCQTSGSITLNQGQVSSDLPNNFSYQWIDTTTGSVISTLEEPILPADSYGLIYVVTDLNSGCRDTGNYNVFQDSVFFHNANPLTADCDSTGNGSAEFQAPLLPGATYGLFGGPYSSSSPIINNLPKGLNLVGFMDPASGCIGMDTVYISGNIPAGIEFTSNGNCTSGGTICPTNSNIQHYDQYIELELNFAGPENFDTIINPYFGWQCVPINQNGNYTITMTDHTYGCTAPPVNFNHTNGGITPLSFTNSGDTSDICAQGNATMNLTISGSGDYTINLLNTSGGLSLLGNETFPIQTTSASLFIDSIMVNGTGSISIQVIDNSTGCTSNQSFAYTGSISNLNYNTNITPSSCGNGQIHFMINDPTNQPYSILWDTGDTSWFVFDMDPGSYNATITNLVSGCIWNETVTVPFDGGGSCGEVSGYVYIDANQNCVFDAGDSPLTWVSVDIGGTSVYTDLNGYYHGYPNSSSVTIQPNVQYSNFVPNCPASGQINLSVSPNQTYTNNNFAFIPDGACYELGVEIFHTETDPCESGEAILFYNNYGSVYSPTNTEIKIAIDTSMTVDDVVDSYYNSISYTIVGDTLYIPVGSVSSMGGDQIRIEYTLNCVPDLNSGDVFCSVALITPGDNCNITPSSVIQVTPYCDGDTAKFIVTNTSSPGIGDMQSAEQYSIATDPTNLNWDQGIYQLNGGESTTISTYSGGTIIMFETYQPGPLYYSLTTYASCGGTGQQGAELLIGTVQSSSSSSSWMECLQAGYPYDPNDKQVSPAGLGTDHLVQNNQWLNYKIRFQNTGSDTATNVVISDTLDMNLDLSTFQSLGSSDPYTVNLTNNIVTWTFANINLPDSTTDEPGSKGFINFRINMNPNLSPGTVIENEAGIYFDYNPPIITNTAWVTIHDFGRQLGIDEEITNQNLLNIYPNPAKDHVQIECSKGYSEVSIYDLQGKQVAFYVNENLLNVSGLTPGEYIIQIKLLDGTKLYKKLIKI